MAESGPTTNSRPMGNDRSGKPIDSKAASVAPPAPAWFENYERHRQCAIPPTPSAPSPTRDKHREKPAAPGAEPAPAATRSRALPGVEPEQKVWFQAVHPQRWKTWRSS